MMESLGKTEMRIRMPRDIDLLGTFKDRRITVGAA